MSDLSLLPAAPHRAEVELRLRDRAERHVLSPARQRGYELRLLGATVLPQRQTIVRSAHGTWLFVDHVEDPTALEYDDKIPIPAAEHAKLLDLYEGGVNPDLVWLGHQLPADYCDEDPLPRLVPDPAHLREKDQRLVQWLRTGAKLWLGAAAGLGALALSPLAIAGAAGAGLDPIVLGGVRDPELPVVQWVLLAQWEWE
jgi:hypothetical protein